MQKLLFVIPEATPPLIDNETASNETLTVILDDKLVINCPVTGKPIPKITWYKDNNPLQPITDENLKLYDGGSRLKITKTQISDGGMYRCEGSNVAGNTTKDFKVDVHGKAFCLDIFLPRF